MLAEFRFAARALARWRGGLAVSIVTLAIGIGTTTSLYALVRVMLADFPGVPDVDRVARIYAASPSLGVERSPVALNEFDATLSRARSFSAIGGYANEDATIGSARDARTVIAGYASPGFFAAMGVAPSPGRVFSLADVATTQPVVMVSTALWRKQFPDGRLADARLVVDGVERAVVGVMPPEFAYSLVGVGADLYLPLGAASRTTPSIVAVYGRLRPGTTWPQAAAELEALGRARAPWTWRAITLAEDARKRATGAYAFTLGPSALILLIACINVACLLMARGLERDKELSVRRALGATRAHVVQLLLTENLLLAAISGALGAGLAVVVLRALAAAATPFQPAVAARISADVTLLPVALGVSALACLLFGTTPALRLSRRDVAASLNGVPAPHRINIAGYGARDLIVFGETAAAVGLIVWTAMLFTVFAQLQAISMSFPGDRVVAMRVPSADADAVAARVAAIPGIARVATSAGMLGSGDRIRVQTADGRSAVLARVPVRAAFLETLGVPLIRGRWFLPSETGDHSGVVILSESAATRLAPGGDALGMTLPSVGGRPAVVIGVCRDALDYGSLTQAGLAPSEIYTPYGISGAEVVVLARTMTDAHAALRAIADAAQTPVGMRPARPVVLSDEFSGRAADGGVLVIRILGAFAVLTLLLAASGVFAVINQSVTQRTREFGIRMAIGAAPRRVLGMVLAREGKLIVAAVGTGLAFAFGLTRALFVELTTLNAALPWMWIGALSLATSVAAAACLLATWRIVRLEPSAILRRT